MRKLALLACLALAAGGPVSTASADPVWVPPQGTFHASFAYTQAIWDQYLQGDGTSVALPGEVDQYEFTTYAEYVPIENLSFDITFPIVFTQRKFVFLETDLNGQIIGASLGPDGEVRDVDTNKGLGDVTLGAKYIFWDRGASIGVRPYVKLPGTYATGELANAPGDGQTDLGLSLLAGTYIPSIRTYFRGSLSFVLRTGAPANQIDLMIEPGVNLTDKLNARFMYQFTAQNGGTDFDYYSTANYYPGNKENTHRIGGGLTYRATDLLGIFGLYQQSVAGRNTANVKAFTIGLDFSF
ncbi:MAG: transporter [Pseudomonadota bacterium]